MFNNTRKLIGQREDKVSWLQILGFLLILTGIICLLIALCCQQFLNGERISIIFFITMMGMALAFPELLRDPNKGLSTMRLVVFMMVNVICILLLKIGWAVADLGSIGLNGYWVGIIAFVFGSKATQSYFESKLAVPPKDNAAPNTPQTAATPDKNIIRMAIRQQPFRQQPGVVGEGIGSRMVDGAPQPCMQVNVDDPKWIPVYNQPLEIQLDNNEVHTLTPYVVYVGVPSTHSGFGGTGILNIGSSNGSGTLGCLVTDNTTKAKHILSCQHVLNHDTSYGQVSDPADIALVAQPTVSIGRHVAGFLTTEIDAAVALITSNPDAYGNANLGIIKDPYDLKDEDTNGTLQIQLSGFDTTATLTGSIKMQTGVVVSHEFFVSLLYPDGNRHDMEDLIVLGQKNGAGFSGLSDHGYSGALVIDEHSRPIGLLIGGDDNFSYAIPINKVLTALNCTIANS